MTELHNRHRTLIVLLSLLVIGLIPAAVNASSGRAAMPQTTDIAYLLTATVTASPVPGTTDSATPEPVDQPDATPLSSSRWELLSYGSPTEQVEVITDSGITLTFDAGNGLSGFGGCNSYSGTYVADSEGTLTVDAVVSTLIACTDSAVMVQEQTYYEALQSAIRYELVTGDSGDEQLIVTYGDGDQLVFAALPALVNAQWVLATYGASAAPQTTDGSAPLTLTFSADGQVSGSGGCNNFNGSYTVDGDSPSIGDLISTRRACADDSLNQQEQAFFQALSTATGYTLTAEQLVIQYGEGETAGELVFDRQSELSNTRWGLESYGAADLPAPLVPNSQITLEFSGDHQAGGNGGCNSYATTYTTDGSALTFEPIASTLIACAGGAGEQEQLYLAALETVTAYEIRGDQLILTYGDAGEQLLFNRLADATSR